MRLGCPGILRPRAVLARRISTKLEWCAISDGLRHWAHLAHGGAQAAHPSQQQRHKGIPARRTARRQLLALRQIVHWCDISLAQLLQLDQCSNCALIQLLPTSHGWGRFGHTRARTVGWWERSLTLTTGPLRCGGPAGAAPELERRTSLPSPWIAGPPASPAAFRTPSTAQGFHSYRL